MLEGHRRDADVVGGGADLLFTGVNFEDAAGNVAEYHDIPLATLHLFPLRSNGQFVPFLPARLGRSAMKAGNGWHGRTRRRLSVCSARS